MNITSSIFSFGDSVCVPNIFNNFRDMSSNLSTTELFGTGNNTPQNLAIGKQPGVGIGQRIAISDKLSNGKFVIAISGSSSSFVIATSNGYYQGVLFSNDSGNTFKYVSYGSSYNGTSGHICMSVDASYVYHATGSTVAPQLRIFENVSNSFTTTRNYSFANSPNISSVSCSEDGKYVCAGGLYNATNQTIMYVSSNYGNSFTIMNGSNLNISNFNASTYNNYVSCISNDGNTIYVATGISATCYLFKLTNVINTDGSVNNNPNLYQYSTTISNIWGLSLSSNNYLLVSSSAFTYVFTDSSFNMTSEDLTNFTSGAPKPVTDSNKRLPLIFADRYCKNAVGVGFNTSPSGISYPWWNGAAYYAVEKKQGWNYIATFPPDNVEATSTKTPGVTNVPGWACCGINREGTMAALTVYQYNSTYFTINNKLYLTQPY